jgi:hypothetical protein
VFQGLFGEGQGAKHKLHGLYIVAKIDGVGVGAVDEGQKSEGVTAQAAPPEFQARSGGPVDQVLL